MPLYEYQCDACSHRFEVIQKFSDSPIETCPKCGGDGQEAPVVAGGAFQGRRLVCHRLRQGRQDRERQRDGQPGGESREGRVGRQFERVEDRDQKRVLVRIEERIEERELARTRALESERIVDHRRPTADVPTPDD